MVEPFLVGREPMNNISKVDKFIWCKSNSLITLNFSFVIDFSKITLTFSLIAVVASAATDFTHSLFSST